MYRFKPKYAVLPLGNSTCLLPLELAIMVDLPLELSPKSFVVSISIVNRPLSSTV